MKHLPLILGMTGMIFSNAATLPVNTQADSVPNKSNYLHIRDEVENNLQRQVLAMWFPRAVDNSNGGFHEGYDEQWKPEGSPTQRSIVYQSRLTWTAGQAASRSKGKEQGEYKEYARQGLECLLNKMWDKEMG